MGTFNSGRMENNDVISGSEDSSDPVSDLVTILQCLVRSGEVNFSFLNPDDSEDDFVVTNTKRTRQPNTEALDKSEISAFIKKSAGVISKNDKFRQNSIAAMVCARERGLHGTTTFSKGDRCRISNNFLPNKGKVVASYPAKIFCGFYLNNGDTFLSASQDGFIRLFDTSNGNFLLVKTILARDVGWSILDVAISPDESYLAYSSWCESLQLCKIWGNSDDQDALLLCLDERKICIFSLKFSNDGKEILCGANDGYIYVYDRDVNQRTIKILGHYDDVNSVAFADDRSLILYSGGDDGVCKVWDRRTLRESHPKPVGCLAGHMCGITFIEPRGDGRHLLTNSKDQSIKLWDVRKFSSNVAVINTKEAVERFDWDYRWSKAPKPLNDPNKRLEGDTSIMTYFGHSVLQTLCRCHFSPAVSTGQRYIYAGCAAGRVVVYDVLTGKMVTELTGHRACVRDVSWHPYRPEITSVSWDEKIIRWTYHEKLWLDSDDEDGMETLAATSTRGKRTREKPRRRSKRIADRKNQHWKRD